MSASQTKPVGIVVATFWEARPLLKHFRFSRLESRLYKTEIHGVSALLCVSGVGQKAASAASFRLCQKGAKRLVSAGFCGALVPELHVGDLVAERMVTVDKPASNRAQRLALAEKTRPVAVDMETQAVVEAGTRCGVPIHTLRVVSDELDDDLTPLFGADGTFVPWKMALRILNPGIWPLLGRLRQHSKVAMARLIREVDAFFKNIDAR
jgi:nucleoside phosphorylase